MEVTIGEAGLTKTWQRKFDKEVTCPYCNGMAKIAFVAFEGPNEDAYVCDLHKNIENNMWVHDACAVAVYFCKKCLEPVAKMNQA